MVVAVLAIGVLTVFLLLAVLGTMREMVLLRADMNAFEQLIKRPPPPSFVNDVAPGVLIDTLKAELPDGSETEQTIVAFVSPQCGPCENLIGGLSSAAKDEADFRAGGMLFVIPSTPSTVKESADLASQLPGPATVDVTGSLMRACEVRGTPTILVVSRSDYRVIDYNVEGDVQWVLRHLNPRPGADAPTRILTSST